MRSRLLVALALALAFLPAAGCLLVRDVDALGARDPVGAAGGGADAEQGEGDTGAPAGEDGGVDAAAEAGCPGEAGPPMVRVGSYCIDATEVTVGHYRAFYNDRGLKTEGQRPECAWNTSFLPDGGMLGLEFDRIPVVNVDFCDAVAYCEWAGKRLCGAIGGGAIAITERANALRSQWYKACSRDGTHEFPYGAYNPTFCNGGDRDAGKLLPVGSLSACEGGYPGIFDLAGNVREWEDACDDGLDQERRCLVRGGAFYDIASTLACSNEQRVRITSQNNAYGFRCCAP